MSASEKGAKRAADAILEDPAAAVREAQRLAEESRVEDPDPVLPDGKGVVRMVMTVEDAWTPEAAVEGFIDEIVRHGLNSFAFLVQRPSDGEVFVVQDGRVLSRQEALAGDADDS